MATMVYTSTKTRPCHYWMNGDRCKFTAAQCRFAHSMGTFAAHQPQPHFQGKVDPPKVEMKGPNEVKGTEKANDIKEALKEEDLISLCSFVEETPKAGAPKIEATKVEAPKGAANKVETPKVEAPKSQVQKPRGPMSNGGPGRGRSLKNTPKTSPKYSPKQTAKKLIQTRNKSPQQTSKQSPSPSIESVDGSIARDLRTAIVEGKGLKYIKNFLSSKPTPTVTESLSLSRHGVSAIFSAVAEGRNDVLRLMMSHGADPNARHLPSGIPVLASAIFQNNGAAIIAVSVLLEFGADPFVIPQDLWADNASFSSIKDDPLKIQWCDEANKNLLSKCFNLSVKHYLQEAAKKIIDPSKPGDATSGPNIINRESSNHLMIGQEDSLRRVNENLRCHMLCGANEPLVLAFVGPAGHGKTELARRIGTIQTIWSPIPMSIMSEKTPTTANGEPEPEIARTHAPYGADNINVICLDDLKGVDLQLLTSILEGNDKAINHKKTVVILSTTLDITKFPLDYYRHLSPEVNDPMMWLAYESQAKKHLANVYGHSIASRVASIIPFVPFTPKEAALIAHKSILDAADELTKSALPLPTTGPNRDHHVCFTVDVDARVCEFIGEGFYDISAGARSIQQAVLTKVKLRMVEVYVKAHAVDGQLPLNFVIRLNADKSVSVVLE